VDIKELEKKFGRSKLAWTRKIKNKVYST
jgi:hypothetical protein